MPRPYGSRTRSNRIGVTLSVLAHIAALLAFLLHKSTERHAPPPSSAQVVYASPMREKAKAKPTPQRTPQKVAKVTPSRVQRLPNTITLPNERTQPVVLPPPVVAPPPQIEEDMFARIAARQKQRADAQAASQDSPAPQESEGERAKRAGLANIAGANGRSLGDDRDDTGGMFTVTSNSLSADVKFRGWNSNFKRKWSQHIKVSLGSEPDIETAVVKTMIELIRKEKKGDFVWESQRLGRNVPMSARVEDTAVLFAFLMKEMFPQYRPPRN